MDRPLGSVVIRSEPLNIGNSENGSLTHMLIRKPLATTAGPIKRYQMLRREIFF